jgi:hypothetical protein
MRDVDFEQLKVCVLKKRKRKAKGRRALYGCGKREPRNDIVLDQ